MTGTTTNYGFLYPTQTDDICDSVKEDESGHMQVFVTQVEAELDEFEATIDRATNPPMCFVQYLGEPQDLAALDPASLGYIHWNDVLVDNFDMFDIGSDPSKIVLPLGYRWQVGIYLDLVGSGFNGEFQITVETGTGSNPTASTHDAGTTDEYASLTDLVTPSGTDGYLKVKVVHATVTNVDLRSGRCWAYWHSDV